MIPAKSRFPAALGMTFFATRLWLEVEEQNPIADACGVAGTGNGLPAETPSASAGILFAQLHCGIWVRRNGATNKPDAPSRSRYVYI